tara:strand:+ start:3841 stop:6630 length:2790 start_codon:yes stop_codon:yes gene_type:complete
MRKILILLLITSITVGQNSNPNFLDGTIMFKFESFVEAKDTSIKILDGIGIEENIEDYPEISDIFRDYTIIAFERPSYFSSVDELKKIYRIKINEDNYIDSLIDELTALNFIEFAEREPLFKIDFQPNDYYYNGSGSNNLNWYHDLINSEGAWDISLGSTNILIAIVDNAIDVGHIDLNIVKAYDVADTDGDPNPPLNHNQSSVWSHGTHVAGLAAALTNNEIGIASLGGNARIIAVKASYDNSDGDVIHQTYDGVIWACENGANVVNLSLGGNFYSNSIESIFNGYTDVVFVGAAGNSNTSERMYPAAYDNVIGVGSVNANGTRSSFSNYNDIDDPDPWVDISAPGGFSFNGLLSTVASQDNDSYGFKGGTSMASPLASGLAGLMLAVNPSLSRDEILNCFQSTGVSAGEELGPRINAYSAMLCAQPEDDVIAAFLASSPTNIYQGDSVFFNNFSIAADNANYSWEFEGGSPSTQNNFNPGQVIYNDVGIFDVTLTVFSGPDIRTLTRENYIKVNETPIGGWTVQNTAFVTQSRGVKNISIANENVVWITAYDGSGNGNNVQEFSRTNDNGQTWSPGFIDVGNSELGISMIHAISYDTAWVVAYPFNNLSYGGIYKTNDGGITWNRQNTANYSAPGAFANVVYFWDENIGFAQGDPIDGEYELYTTIDGGENWNEVDGNNIPNPLEGEYGYVRQIEVYEDNVWYTTNKGRIYHSIDKGFNWVVYNTNVTDFAGIKVSFANENDGVYIDLSGAVYRSFNGGASWQQIDTQGPIFTSDLSYAPNSNTIFTTGASSGSSGSSVSFDGGYSWTGIDVGTQHTAVEFIDENTGWSGGFNFSATQGGIFVWEPIELSIESLDMNESITFYPNPVSDFLNISYTKPITASVFDISGKLIIETNEKKIDFSNLKSGIYFVEIQDDRKTKVIKIIKE